VITEDGRDVAMKATADLNADRFALGALGGGELRDLFGILRTVRQRAGDFKD